MPGLNIGRYDWTTLPNKPIVEDAYSEAIIEMADGCRLGFRESMMTTCEFSFKV
jgi:hypothetical protein